jgi:hypothetical protein
VRLWRIIGWLSAAVAVVIVAGPQLVSLLAD